MRLLLASLAYRACRLSQMIDRKVKDWIERSQEQGAIVARPMLEASGHRNIGRIFVLHALRMIARIDMMNFAGYAASQIGQQVKTG